MPNDVCRSETYLAPAGTLSYPSLFSKSDHGKYEATQIWAEGTDLAIVEKAIDEACTKKWGKDWSKSIGKKIKYPIHSNEDSVNAESGLRRKGYEDDNGRYAAFRSTSLPNVIGNTRDADGKWVRLAQEEIWAGCQTVVSFYALAGVMEGPYCSLRLQNIQRVAEGDPISGGYTPDPEDDFTGDADVMAALGETVAV